MHKLPKYTLTNVLIVAAALSAAEIASYLYLKRTSPFPIHDERAVVPEEMAKRVFAKTRLGEMQAPMKTPAYNVDDNGFRSSPGLSDVFAGYDPAAFNIFAFGGSMTFGYGVKDAETWPAQLQRMLSSGAKVYNVGQDGTGSYDEVYLLVQLLVDGRWPKLAIFMDGVNESCPEPADRSKMVRDLMDQSLAQANLNWLLSKSSTAALLRRHFAMGSATPSETVDRSTCADAYARRAMFNQRLLASYGAKSFFMFQPSGSTIPNYTTYKFWAYGNPSKEMVTAANSLYDAYITRARAAGVKNVFDLRHAFDAAAEASQEVLIDHAHPTGLGQSIVAREVYRIIEASHEHH